VAYQEDDELAGAAPSALALSSPSPTPSAAPSPTPPPFNVTPDQIKDTLTKSNIASAISQLSGDPAQAGKLMAEAKATMPPSMLEAARKMAVGSQGDQIAREMKKQGVNRQEVVSQMKEQKKAAAQARAAMQGPTKKVVVLTHSRKFTQKEVSIAQVAAPLKCETAIQIPCSRLARGPLTGKSIKVWYNPDDASVNRRAMRILDTRVGGDVIFENSDGDLFLKDLEAVEKLL
jgi:hypothetical protein